jgi:hypothetical protein
MKNPRDMTIEELKVLAFDLDQQGKYISQQYTAIIQVLQQKMQESKHEPSKKK